MEIKAKSILESYRKLKGIIVEEETKPEDDKKPEVKDEEIVPGQEDEKDTSMPVEIVCEKCGHKQAKK